MNLQELHALFLKSSGVSTDTRSLVEGELFFALKGHSHNANTFAHQALKQGAIAAVVDQHFEETHDDRFIKVNDTLKTLQQLANYHRNTFKIPVLALTGSNGKTTTKELINAVLSARFKTLTTHGNLNNHIGVPLTLLRLKASHEIAVVEMGANHQGEISLLSAIAEPTHGLITNFGKAHIEGFGGIEGVIKGKQELYAHLLSRKGVVFFNENDPIQVTALKGHTSKIPYQLAQENEASNPVYAVEVVQTAPKLILKYRGLTIESPLFGTYNATNIAAAIAIGEYFGVELRSASIAISSYKPSNMRSEILTVNGKPILLDAYNANPSSMESALKLFSSFEWPSKAVVLGDMFELGEFAEEEHQKIVHLLSQLSFDQVYLVGKNFAKTSSTFQTFPSTEELMAHFPSALKSAALMIKGSRAMALERILDKLQ